MDRIRVFPERRELVKDVKKSLVRNVCACVLRVLFVEHAKGHLRVIFVFQAFKIKQLPWT